MKSIKIHKKTSTVVGVLSYILVYFFHPLLSVQFCTPPTTNSHLAECEIQMKQKTRYFNPFEFAVNIFQKTMSKQML